jgi:hypothetical protein
MAKINSDIVTPGLKVNYTPTQTGGTFDPMDQQRQEKAAYEASLKKSSMPKEEKPIVPEVPKTPTVSDIYGGLVTPEETALKTGYSDYEKYTKEQLAPVDEAAVRQKTMEQFQAEIDAMNKIYAQKKQEEAVAGQGRLGSSAAIQARSGLLGSDFGAAQTEKTNRYNQDLQDSIDAEKAYKIQEILGKANTEAKTEIDAKKLARQQGYTAYMEYLKGATERSNQKVTSYADQLLYSGTEINDQDLKALAEQLGVSPQALKAQYNKAKETKDAAKKSVAPTTQMVGNTLYQYDPETKTWKEQFTGKSTEKAAGLMEVSPGASIYDPVTGEFKGTAPERPKDDTTPLKIVEIDGVKYWDDGQGNLTKPVVPQAAKQVTPEQSQSARDMVKQIDDIILSKGFSGAVGANWGSIIPNFIVSKEDYKNMAGTERASTMAKITSLLASKTLENMGKIKGVLSDSDMALLRAASTGGLSTNMTEEEFTKKINEMKYTALSVANAPTMSPGSTVDNGNGSYSYMNKDGTVHTGPNGDGYQDNTAPMQNTNDQSAEIDSMRKQLEADPANFSPQEIEAALKEEYPSFNKELQTSSNGVAMQVSSIPDNEKGGQCGRFVNKLTGLAVGDSYKSKLSKMDPNITEPEPGMVFTMPYKDTGHIGFIVGVRTDENGDQIATVKDSNYYTKTAPETIKTHDIPVSKMTGFRRVTIA